MATVPELVRLAANRARVELTCPDDLGVDVREGTLGGFPDHIGNGGRLVEHDQDALALVV